ncbi:Scr1 family TA system antitoxin-like transcriptional regulator [Streptomyces sp. NPDC056061]|uniref:Scr1 family TA system antitoxin-like transcriptional regulator n=1 Tax=Streptomyces sp. NPDC056061 TaxID=3345700 RepID=UPI0035D8F014
MTTPPVALRTGRAHRSVTTDHVRALLGAGPKARSLQAIDERVAIRQVRRKAIEEQGARFAAVIREPALTAPMPSGAFVGGVKAGAFTG